MVPVAPLAYQWYHGTNRTIGRANGTIGITIGTNGITNSRKRRDVTSGPRSIATRLVGVNKPIIPIVVNREPMKNEL